MSWVQSMPLYTVCYATDADFCASIDGEPVLCEFVTKRPKMDDLLMSSSLRRAANGAGDFAPRRQIVLKEKPLTPYIVLPAEDRFHHLIQKPRFAIDIGGTLCKLVYTTVCHEEGSDRPEVLLNFKKFVNFDDCLSFVKEEWHQRCQDDTIHCTGGGAFKYSEILCSELGVRMARTDEMQSLIQGCDFLLKNNEDESFTYHHEDIGLERYQYKPISADLVFPFLLVNIGTGISILKVNSPTSYERIGGSSMGGGTFIGLGHLLTNVNDFDELLKLAEKGDHRRVDTLVSDIYGGGYEALNLSSEVIAGSFGKCHKYTGNEITARPEDHAKSLLLMISNNIGQMAMLYGNRFNTKRIYFGGFFIRKHPITMRTLSYAIKFWSKGDCEALFMKHEGYLGAVGAFLSDLEKAN